MSKLRINKIMQTIKIMDLKEERSTNNILFLKIMGEISLKVTKEEYKEINKKFMLVGDQAELFLNSIKIFDDVFTEGFYNALGSITISHWQKI